ncbi:MAG: vitamin B12-dependent ribonucleotide reductase, partial [Paracoccaceae bacterium]
LDRTDLAHVKPQGESFDDLGRGEGEGRRNFTEAAEGAVSRSLEGLRQISSTGYLRKRVPQELIVLQGGVGTVALAASPEPPATLQTMAPETARQGIARTAAAAPLTNGARAKAKMQGFEGDPCSECGNYTMVRNGTCMKCNTCGGTSGCN